MHAEPRNSGLCSTCCARRSGAANSIVSAGRTAPLPTHHLPWLKATRIPVPICCWCRERLRPSCRSSQIASCSMRTSDNRSPGSANGSANCLMQHEARIAQHAARIAQHAARRARCSVHETSGTQATDCKRVTSAHDTAHEIPRAKGGQGLERRKPPNRLPPTCVQEEEEEEEELAPIADIQAAFTSIAWQPHPPPRTHASTRT